MIKHIFRKRWSQNFLIDQNIIKKIITTAQESFSSQSIIIEIGPGNGALTWLLAQHFAKLYCIEIDQHLINSLKTQITQHNIQNINIIHADILKISLDNMCTVIHEKYSKTTPIIVIANLPYKISSQFLIQILKNRTNIAGAILMFQYELANRILSKTGKKSYGSLSVIAQILASIKKVCLVSRNSFYPKPNVDSMVLKFTFLSDKKFQKLNYNFFFKFIQNIFNYRRKTLINNLKNIGWSLENIEDAFQILHLSSRVRCDNLLPNQLWQLYQISLNKKFISKPARTK